MLTDQEEIANRIESFAAAYKAGDLASVLSYYDDDLVKVRQGGRAESKVELATRLRHVFDQFRTEVHVDNLELEVSGALAFTRGTFVVTLEPRNGGAPQQVSRRYLEVWRHTNGCWRVARTMDNSE